MPQENFTVIKKEGDSFVDIASEGCPGGFATVWSFGVKHAQLMAAAPRLLEALEGLLQFPLGTHQVEAAKKAVEAARAGDV